MTVHDHRSEFPSPADPPATHHEVPPANPRRGRWARARVARALVVVRQVWGGGWRAAVRWRWPVAAFLAVAVVAVGWCIRHDEAALAAFYRARPPSLDRYADAVGKWGDFLPGTVPFAALLGAAGVLARNRRCQRAAVACLLAAVCAGLLANSIRLTVGRTRPNAVYKKTDRDIPAPKKPGDPIPYGFYGPRGSYRYQGFPSGHSATALGTGVAAAIAVPPIGIPALAYWVSVPYARLQTRSHYPSDVVAGSALGIVCGACFGMAARRRGGWPK